MSFPIDSSVGKIKTKTPPYSQPPVTNGFFLQVVNRIGFDIFFDIYLKTQLNEKSRVAGDLRRCIAPTLGASVKIYDWWINCTAHLGRNEKWWTFYGHYFDMKNFPWTNFIQSLFHQIV